MSAKPCPVCKGGHVVVYNDGGQRVEHYPNCTPALRSLWKVADAWERDEWGDVPISGIGEFWKSEVPLVRAIRRYRKERAK